MQHEADHEKSGTKNKTLSTPMADAVAKVERALRGGGLTTSHLTVTDEGHGSFRINANIEPDESVFGFFERVSSAAAIGTGNLADQNPRPISNGCHSEDS